MSLESTSPMDDNPYAPPTVGPIAERGLARLRQQLFRLLPYASGATIGVLLLFQPAPLVALGVWQLPIWGAVMLLGFFASVGLQMAVSMPEEVKIEPEDVALPPELVGWMSELLALGFEPVGRAYRVHLRPAALTWVLRHAEAGCWASVSQTGTLPRRALFDITSVLAGCDGQLVSLAERLGAVFPLPPGCLKQVLPGASPRQVFARHLEAVELLSRHGIATEPAAQSAVADAIREAIARQRRVIMANPVRAAAIAIWRANTRRSPYTRPLAEQPGFAAALARLAPTSSGAV